MFAREPIKAGEVILVWGGVVLTKEELEVGRYRKGTLSAIAENLWLGDSADGEDYAADYTNHSCDPNLWMKDEVTLAARRDIAAGEELTADYMMWEADENYRAAWQCKCRSPHCRKIITGRDWWLPELQERYKDHFSPFLNKRIQIHNSQSDVTYSVSPLVTNDELNTLFAAAWREHSARDFSTILNRSLAFVCAYHSTDLIGFVNLAWDGGIHAFVLDTTVHPEYQRRGIGRKLVQQATAVAKEHGMEWLHVDFEPHLQHFYDGCGFKPTNAGLINLIDNEVAQ